MDTNQDVSNKLLLIKTKMPKTYEAIQAKANASQCEANGKKTSPVYEYVRRALRGEAGFFWACEAGHVVGTPFDRAFAQAFYDVFVDCGSEHMCIMRGVHTPAQQGGAHGAH